MFQLPEVLALVAVFMILTLAQQEDLSIRAADVNCTIPNESTNGVCVEPQNCPAFRNITAGQQLGDVGRLSFVRALECLFVNETLICCPLSGDYVKPELSVNVTKRHRNATSIVVTRFGEENEQPRSTMKLRKIISHIDEYPWAALLFYSANKTLCGGALISSKFVLTAAHCLTGEGYDLFGPLEYIRLGEYDTFSNVDRYIEKYKNVLHVNKEAIDVRSKSVKIHPDYEPDTFQQYNDIGLIELSHEVALTIFTVPICLPEPRFKTGLEKGHYFSVCGWGKSDVFPGSPNSPVKLKVTPFYVEPHVCENNYRAQHLSLGPGQFCAGGKNGQDACSRDSGSPLMFYDKLELSWVLSGIVARGSIKCGEDNKPGIYTNVRYYLSWIKANTEL